MEESIRRCDFPVGRGANRKPHMEQVEDGEPTRFRVGGKEYEADLCLQHREALVEAVQPWISIARRAGTVAPRNAKGRAIMRAKGGALFTTKDVRQWLVEQGDNVPPTGRIPNADIDRYKAAHGIG